MSNFNFLNLTDGIRQMMLSEINSDIASGKIYISTRLNADGAGRYSAFLLNAAINGNPESLQNDLESGDFFNPTYLRQDKQVKMPSNAAQLLSQSEFNRFYIRAVCLYAIEQNIEEIEIYRARESSWARPESELKIGSKLNPHELLEDLRNSIGVEPKILPEINSGLSLKI